MPTLRHKVHISQVFVPHGYRIYDCLTALYNTIYSVKCKFYFNFVHSKKSEWGVCSIDFTLLTCPHPPFQTSNCPVHSWQRAQQTLVQSWHKPDAKRHTDKRSMWRIYDASARLPGSGDRGNRWRALGQSKWAPGSVGRLISKLPRREDHI